MGKGGGARNAPRCGSERTSKLSARQVQRQPRGYLWLPLQGCCLLRLRVLITDLSPLSPAARIHLRSWAHGDSFPRCPVYIIGWPSIARGSGSNSAPLYTLSPAIKLSPRRRRLLLLASELEIPALRSPSAQGCQLSSDRIRRGGLANACLLKWKQFLDAQELEGCLSLGLSGQGHSLAGALLEVAAHRRDPSPFLSIRQ